MSSKNNSKNNSESLSMFFNPRSIAVVGASRDPASVGHGVLKNLKEGCVFKCKYCKPFLGRIYAVNPNAQEVAGVRCYPSLRSIGDEIDLAIIAVPAKSVASVIKDCAFKKIKSVIIISAGFAEIGSKGRKLQEELVKIARKVGIRIIGPNCLGVIRPSSSLNASFAPTMPPDGNIAFVSQSGALADSIIDWAIDARYGFSTIISVGNKADVDFPDLLEWLLDDAQTKAITMYIEGVNDGRRLMEVAKKVALVKPIIVLKAGRTATGSDAVSSHTGSLAGSYAVFEAAMKQSKVLVADSVEEMFDIAKALSQQPGALANSIAIVTNAGGAGVLTADYCESIGIGLAKLSKKVINKLEDKMHPAYSRSNPLDIVGDALPEKYELAIDAVLGEKNVAGLIVIQTLQTMTDSIQDAQVIINAHQKYPNKPVISTYMGGKFSRPGVELLEQNGIPDYNDPLKAARVMRALIERGRMMKKK